MSATLRIFMAAAASVIAVLCVATAKPGSVARPERAARAQPPIPATSPAGTTVPPPYIAGEWSVTRTWLRRCPQCAFPVVRTTPWLIMQDGDEVLVDRGPRGTIAGASGGGGYLTLQGAETGGLDVQRFWYSTLTVTPGGDHFEGGFGGSERVQNPCGSSPPIVTCLVSAGWISAQRIATAEATAAPSPTTPPSPTVAATATPAASPTSSATPSATPSPTATARPVPLHFPSIGKAAP